METTMEGLGSMAGYGSAKTRCWEERRRRAAGPRRGRLAPRYPTPWSTLGGAAGAADAMALSTKDKEVRHRSCDVLGIDADEWDNENRRMTIELRSSNTSSGRHWKTGCKSVGRPPRWGDGSSSI
ncbi:hypothetical protein ACJX0J_013663, partial [Zea mays]